MIAMFYPRVGPGWTWLDLAGLTPGPQLCLENLKVKAEAGDDGSTNHQNQRGVKSLKNRSARAASADSIIPPSRPGPQQSDHYERKP